ncbi:cuticle collagen 7-like [Elephas maximus indicus]|uniref:cuticle collagen 7-like n=1 Tax=Elephas maximus indicus TaxID=99487 RepID=UPI0021168238|nr:cuticle collagen 7-like [Elephas maximus indicus]
MHGLPESPGDRLLHSGVLSNGEHSGLPGHCSTQLRLLVLQETKPSSQAEGSAYHLSKQKVKLTPRPEPGIDRGRPCWVPGPQRSPNPARGWTCRERCRDGEEPSAPGRLPRWAADPSATEAAGPEGAGREVTWAPGRTGPPGKATQRSRGNRARGTFPARCSPGPAPTERSGPFRSGPGGPRAAGRAGRTSG